MVQRQVDVLRYLHDQAGGGDAGVSLSLRRIREDCNLSEGQVRLALAALRDRGLLRVRPQMLSNGGTAENAYIVTEQGRSTLSDCAREGACVLTAARRADSRAC